MSDYHKCWVTWLRLGRSKTDVKGSNHGFHASTLEYDPLWATFIQRKAAQRSKNSSVIDSHLSK